MKISNDIRYIGVNDHHRLEFLDFVRKNPEYTNTQKIKSIKVVDKQKDKYSDPIYD